jgi:hypothetical protein
MLQAIDMLQLETEALRKALQASEAEVERSHAQRVAEVAVTKAALCAQVGFTLQVHINAFLQQAKL